MISSFATHLNHQQLCLSQSGLSSNTGIQHKQSAAANGRHATQESLIGKLRGRLSLSDKMTCTFIAQRKIGVWQLVAIAYFTTAGGPFGLEVCIQTAGFTITLLGLLIMPIIYATPQALMTAELSNMMPANGGYVIWVFQAFGDFLGYVNAYNAIICNLFDNAIYPTLVMEYYHVLYPSQCRGVSMFIFKEVIVVMGCIVNIGSIRKLGNYGIYTTLLVLLPFTLGFLIALPHVQWDELLWGPIQPDGDHENLSMQSLQPNMALFLSTLFWCHTGWDGLGNFAGEVIDPQRTYPKGVFAAIIINLLNFVTAVIAGMGVMFTQHDMNENHVWKEGYFAIAYQEIWYPLGLGIALSNTIAQIAIYFSCIASTSRILAVMGDNVLSDTLDFGDDDGARETSGLIGDVAEKQRLRLLPKWMSMIDNKSHSPIVAIVVQSALIACLMGYGFAALVEVSVTLNCITLVIEFAAFLHLRYKHPNAPRPYVIPGGYPIAWLITLVKVTLVVTVIVLTTSQLGLVFWITLGCNVAIVTLYIVRKVFGW